MKIIRFQWFAGGVFTVFNLKKEKFVNMVQMSIFLAWELTLFINADMDSIYPPWINFIHRPFGSRREGNFYSIFLLWLIFVQVSKLNLNMNWLETTTKRCTLCTMKHDTVYLIFRTLNRWKIYDSLELRVSSQFWEASLKIHVMRCVCEFMYLC